MDRPHQPPKHKGKTFSKKASFKKASSKSASPPRHHPASQTAADRPRSADKTSPQKPRSASEGAPNTPSPFRPSSSGMSLLYGTHAVRAALCAGRRNILRAFVTPQAAERLADDLGAGIETHTVSNEDLTRRLGPSAVHQGVMIEAAPLEDLDLSDIEPRSGIVLALDQITDPHNIGAILRTAAAFAVDAVVTTERHAPDLSALVAKVASGGLDYVPMVRVGNFARMLDRIAGMGYLRVGLDSEAAMSFEEAPLTRPLALVLGGEGKGLRRLSREKCDLLVRLDMPGAIKSLNVSNACAVALTLTQIKTQAR